VRHACDLASWNSLIWKWGKQAMASCHGLCFVSRYYSLVYKYIYSLDKNFTQAVFDPFAQAGGDET